VRYAGDVRRVISLGLANQLSVTHRILVNPLHAPYGSTELRLYGAAAAAAQQVRSSGSI